MLGIVTVQWNSSQHTIQFIDSILPSLGETIQLVIVDNGSNESHLTAVKEKISISYKPSDDPDNAAITLIENSHNSGFARANNIGINYCLKQNKSWIWLLNNDTTITEKSISDLLEKLAIHSPGIVGTIIREKNNPEIFAGFVFNKWTSQYKAITESSQNLLNETLAYISGASILIHKQVINQIGLLDESTFLYFEELDFCIRSRQFGYKLDLLPEVVINHIAGGSASEPALQQLKTYHETWSTLYFYAKHQKALLPLMLIARTTIKIMMLVLKSRSNEIRSVVKATGDFLRGQNKDLSPVDITGMNYYQ